MKNYKATLKSLPSSPYSQGRHYEVEKLAKEGHADYEKRTWRNRMHVDANGEVFVPCMSFKNCLSEAAKFISMSVPGKGKSTFTKHFEAGVMVLTHMPLGIKASEVQGESLFVPSSGIRGDGKRVTKIFPIIHEWSGSIIVNVVDETITQDVLTKHLIEAGNIIGLGRFRPRNNGYYGRFTVISVDEVG